MVVKDAVALQNLLESAQIDDYLCDFESRYLTQGLTWDESDEGYEYWADLYRKDREWTEGDYNLISLYLIEYSGKTSSLEEDIWL